ncbi:hypothetical protein HHI36_007827 [Cryptolaemus montrouzieri]|uniref:Uncharacterized protein n=1 Tax=Cryptolaemus montrouzieri TaxID=559131 RepID=A0ABD2MQQ1_9CUCU
MCRQADENDTGEGGNVDGHFEVLKSIALRESVDFFSDKITDSERKLKKFEDYFKVIEEIKEENIQLNAEVSKLSSKVNSLEQNSRSKHVDSQDVP